jgi:hypothetical protein
MRSAFFMVMLFVAAPIRADWSDVDCSHWLGTPQWATCAAAHHEQAKGDCSQWTRGGTEWQKCQHERTVECAQRQQRLGNGVAKQRGKRVYVTCP